MDHVRFGPNIGSGGAAQCANDVAKLVPFSMVRCHAARRACSAAIASLAHVCETTTSVSVEVRVHVMRDDLPVCCAFPYEGQYLDAVGNTDVG
jgi:hypothetical protein